VDIEELYARARDGAEHAANAERFDRPDFTAPTPSVWD
jgi:hypothetical protein